MSDEEEWRDIPGYEGYYQASDRGRIRSVSRDIVRGRGGVQRTKEHVLKGQYLSGYHRVSLAKDGKVRTVGVHRLVLMAFVGPPPTDTHHACHNDGNPANNAVANLRWDTPVGNQQDRYEHGTQTNAQKSSCKYGHPFDLSNTYIPPAGGRTTYRRYCRTCGRLAAQRRRQAQREASK